MRDAPAFDPAARWAPAGAEPLLTDDVRALLVQAFGIDPARTAPVDVPLAVGPTRLDGAALAALEAAVGAPHVRMGEADRGAHANGMSYLDLVRRSAAPPTAPDAVVLPGSDDEVRAVLAACVEHRVAVVPFGGGTSVVGGVAPERGGFAAVVALDLARLDALVALDEISHTATLQAGVTGPRAEELLGERGFTLGHIPPRRARPASSRPAGAASTRWSSGCARSRRPATWTSAARPAPRPAPTCASSCSAPRVPWASSPR
jgi:alkyldihydroxyacetonephosphate synthase